MSDPRTYLAEIRENLEKIRAKGHVTETENALFGLIDGLGGMLHRTNERVTELERQVRSCAGYTARGRGTRRLAPHPRITGTSH